MLTKLTELQRQLPKNLDGDYVSVLDEFYTARHRLQALKHDLLIAVQAKGTSC